MLPDNPLRGESTVEIEGRAYGLTFDVSAFIFAQQATGKKMTDLIGGFSEEPDDLIGLRAIFWAGLQRKHPVTLSEAEDLLSSAGIAKARFAVSTALAAALGEKEEGQEQSDPPKVKRSRGTG